MSRLLNDGSNDPPKLRIYLNLGTLVDLRQDSIWPGLDGPERDQRLTADGFDGVQLITDAFLAPGLTLPYCGLDRINTPAEADLVAAKHADRGDVCLTLHLGWGLENDTEVDRLIDAILRASDRHRLPIFIETHRATITQDLWRTVQMTRRFPNIQFNGDFSHYYCGQELVYGDWETKLAFMQPIFDRIGFIHGRIANPGSIQVAVSAHGAVDYVQHFRELWTRSIQGFLKNASPGDVLIFAPELLPSAHYYARQFPAANGRLVEESDRYAEAIIYARIARECMETAQKRARDSRP
jgi:hypothetical protein